MEVPMTPDVPSTAGPLETLLAVQDLDTAIGQLRHRRAGLPERSRLAAVRARLSELATGAASAETARQELATRQADLEGHIASTMARRHAIEQRLYAARGTASRDLQAMDEEIRHLAQRQSELEDAELELMVEQEPLDAALLAFDVERKELVSIADEVSRALAATEAVIDGELSERVTARTAAADSLPEELRDRYETLRARMGGTGAARLVGNRCSGCHLELPSMEVERIRHLPPGTVLTCDQCGRILVPTSSPASSPTAAGSGPGGAAAAGPTGFTDP
jgi:uncharacterized protein